MRKAHLKVLTVREEDDATLVSRCVAGDEQAWACLAQRYQRLVYAIVMNMSLDEHVAADVFQTVFERLVQHLPRLADPSRLQAWVVTTAKREGLRLRERSRRHESISRVDEAGDGDVDQDFVDESLIPEERLSELQLLHQLRLAMDRLDGRCRDLLLLVFRDDDDRLGYDEVARRLGVPVGSIGPTRSRCLEKLRRLVA